MKKILHLSDLHFGTERPGLTALLIKDCLQLKPDIIIVSGDLTQRATLKQYQAARKFLSHFHNQRVLCVPGNHDISLYNLLERFFFPFRKYQQWIASTLCAAYSDKDLAILGINSVTPYKSMGGYVTDEQLSLVIKFFEKQPSNITRIIVMHHNLIKSERHKIINDADKIISVFKRLNIHIVLSGHIHYPWIEAIESENSSHSLYILTAGTAISYRTIQPNSYNIIEIHDRTFNFIVREFTGNKFLNKEQHTLTTR